jgi:CBS domain-containing protein
MKTLKQLLAGKPVRWPSSLPNDTVYHALTVMAQHDVGALLVWMANNWSAFFPNATMPARSSCRARPPRKRWFSEIMSDKVAYVTPTSTLEECMALMTEKRFRHLPVLDDDGSVIRHDLDRRSGQGNDQRASSS